MESHSNNHEGLVYIHSDCGRTVDIRVKEKHVAFVPYKLAQLGTESCTRAATEVREGHHFTQRAPLYACVVHLDFKSGTVEQETAPGNKPAATRLQNFIAGEPLPPCSHVEVERSLPRVDNNSVVRETCMEATDYVLSHGS